MTYTLSLTELTGGHVAIFTEHAPSEFEVTNHYLSSKVDANTAKVDVEPAFKVGMADQVCPPAAGCTRAYEFGGIFAVPASAGTYTWTADKKDGKWGGETATKMKIVALPVADAKEATLTAAKAEAVDGMGHTPCTDVEPGETIVPGEHKCSVLHIEGAGPSVSYWL